MDLLYKPDADDALRRLNAFWHKELLDRPPVLAVCPKAGETIPPGPGQLGGFDGNFAAAVAQFETMAECTYWGAEAFPTLGPSVGPDQFAAFLGGNIVISPDSADTSWVEPFVDDWSQALPLRLDPDNRYWKHILAYMDYAGKAAVGKFLVATLDTHSNMDALGAMRGYQRLCLDMLDCPQVIDEAVEQVRRLYAPIYNAVYEAAGMDRVGWTTSWLGVVGPGKGTCVQCDFAALMSPAQFDRWVMPCLEDETAFLDHAIYHLDGPDAICHLPSLLSLPDLHGIQWVPGAGLEAEGRPMYTWVELLQQVQAAGKSVYCYGPAEALQTLHKQLKPNLVFYNLQGAKTPQEIDNFCRWLEQHC